MTRHRILAFIVPAPGGPTTAEVAGRKVAVTVEEGQAYACTPPSARCPSARSRTARSSAPAISPRSTSAPVPCAPDRPRTPCGAVGRSSPTMPLCSRSPTERAWQRGRRRGDPGGRDSSLDAGRARVRRRHRARRPTRYMRSCPACGTLVIVGQGSIGCEITATLGVAVTAVDVAPAAVGAARTAVVRAGPPLAYRAWRRLIDHLGVSAFIPDAAGRVRSRVRRRAADRP
jgi:hypothetical protein